MPQQQSRKYGVKQRGDKWVARPYVNGAHHWVGTFEDEDEATEAARKFVEQARRLPPSKETVQKFADRWVVDYPRDDSTNDHYRTMAKLFAREYGEKLMRQIGPLDAKRFANKHGGAARSVRTMFSDAKREGVIEVHPFLGMKLGKEGRKGRRDLVVITREEFDMLIEISKNVHPKYDFWQMVVVGGEVGIRPSEMYGLERTDFLLASSEIYVQRQYYRGRLKRPKNHRPRRIICTPAATSAYETLPRYTPIAKVDERGKERPIDFAFRNKSGDPLTQTSMHNYWVPVRAAFEAALSEQRRAELQAPRDPKHPEMDFYELRHRCATDLLERFRADGQDGCADVAIQLGHTDEGELVRDLYGHPSDDLARERLKKLFEDNTRQLRPVEGDGEASHG